MARHLLVGNPTAQSGKNRERIEHALALLGRHGLEVQMLATLPEGRTIGAVRAALESSDFRTVIAMGGDGTFREVGAGLYTSRAKNDVPLAMLPTGTANDQGKSFGLEATADALERNVSVIAAGHETRLDVGLLYAEPMSSPDYFFDSAGWGLSARVLAARNRDRAAVEALGPLKELYRDHAVYAGAFVKTFLGSFVTDDSFRAVATLDGERVELEGLTDLIVKNTRIYAGAWVLDDTARHDDGAFELVPFRGKADWLSKAILDLKDGLVDERDAASIGLAHSTPLRASRITLELSAEADSGLVAAQLDGEEHRTGTRVRIEVDARALRLVVP